MAQVECIGPIQTAMKIRRDSIALACEALSKMFDRGEEELVSQVHTLTRCVCRCTDLRGVFVKFVDNLVVKPKFMLILLNYISF